MYISFPQIKIEEPLSVDALTIFPFFSKESTAVEYMLGSDALAAGTVNIEEVNESGSVPELLVKNRGEIRVLFLEGEALIGAKQNRVLNTSVMVPAKAELKIPVSCVEQGRWHYESSQFTPSVYSSPPKLRHTLKSSVSRSLDKQQGHQSDQGEVWREIKRQQISLCASSETDAMSDTYEMYAKRIDEILDQFHYVEGTTGFAVAVGPKVVSVELFDKPATCAKVWRRLLSGFALDSIEVGTGRTPVSGESVAGVLEQMKSADWKQVAPVGEGEEYRTELESSFGSVLYCEGPLVHGSLVRS